MLTWNLISLSTASRFGRSEWTLSKYLLHSFAIALPSFHRSPRVDDIPGKMRVDRLRCDVKIDLPCSCLQECNKKWFLCYILNIFVKYHRVLFPASHLHFGCHCMLWILCVFCVSGITASNVFKWMWVVYHLLLGKSRAESNRWWVTSVLHSDWMVFALLSKIPSK